MPRQKKQSVDYSVVKVEWLDAEENGDVGWNDLKKQLAHAKKPCPLMKSVGFLVFEGEEHIAILSTIGPDEASTLEKIPKSFIKSITHLVPQTKAK